MRAHTAKDPFFCRDINKQKLLDYPSWLFPVHFSTIVKGLIVSMLHPDPMERIAVVDAQEHPWCRHWEPTEHIKQHDEQKKCIPDFASKVLSNINDKYYMYC